MIEKNLQKCSSCGACQNVCPKNAITLKPNENGFIRPTVNKEKCIDCSLCNKVCQIETSIKKYDIRKIYAAWANKNMRLNSSSGGIAFCLENKCFDQDFSCFGTIYDKNKQISRTIFAKNKIDFEKMKGSKYSLSDTSNVFKEIKQQLDVGKKVLYISTPCQIAGLKLFLQKEYDLLYTVDLICHGVSPYNYLKDELVYLSKKTNSVIDDVSFRGKYNFKFVIYSNNKIFYKKNSQLNPYFNAFLKGISLQEQCYHCNFASKNRVGDLTIGDFIGYDKKNKNAIANPSLIGINTDKGEKLFNLILDDLEFYQEEDISETKKCASLYCPFKKHKLYIKFHKKYIKYNNFAVAIRKSCKWLIIKERIIYYPRGVKNKTKKLLKKLIFK